MNSFGCSIVVNPAHTLRRTNNPTRVCYKRGDKMIKEFVEWKEPKYPKMPRTWMPIDRKKGKVTTGHLICNKKPKGRIVGEVHFSGKPIFSKPIITLYEGYR